MQFVVRNWHIDLNIILIVVNEIFHSNLLITSSFEIITFGYSEKDQDYHYFVAKFIITKKFSLFIAL